MRYIKSNHHFWGLEHEIYDEIQLGDIVSFGTVYWQPVGGIHQYYNPHTQGVTIPEGITLECYSATINKQIDGIWVELNSGVRVELDETFEIVLIEPKTYHLPPTSMNSLDSRLHPGVIFKAKSQKRNIWVQFHFENNYITASEAIFVHEPNDTHADKMKLIYHMANPDNSTRHPEIDRLIHNGEIQPIRFV